MNITLPKTKTVKTAIITVETLHATCSLATSACVSLLAHHENLVLNKASTQLDAITVQLAIPIVSSLNGKQSYADALMSGKAEHGFKPAGSGTHLWVPAPPKPQTC